MIPVAKQNEPPRFEGKVRTPGKVFLRTCPSPHGKEWKKHEYWQAISNEMYQLYQGVCAYTGAWFSKTPAQDRFRPSIDHFWPRSKYPHLAYEWSNYRLAIQQVNKYKGAHDDLADPFTIQFGWFVLLLPSCLIKPGGHVSQQEREMIDRTIATLKLNDDEGFVDLRQNIIQSYIDGSCRPEDMRCKYPFVAYELERQDLFDREKLKLVFKTLPT